MFLYSRMHDNKESRSYQSSYGGSCNCGDCVEFGCDCTDTGSHDNCICGLCGDGPGYEFAKGAGHD